MPTGDPRFQSALPALVVEDVPAAVAFYRDVLGFRVPAEYEGAAEFPSRRQGRVAWYSFQTCCTLCPRICWKAASQLKVAMSRAAWFSSMRKVGFLLFLHQERKNPVRL